MIIKVNYTVSDIYMSTSVSPVYIKVVYSGTSSGGGGVWGTITGTLSAQTDLQSALDLKVPTSRTLTINGVAFDLSANRAWTISSGTVTSVGLSMPSAFSVANSPITTSGTLAVTAIGTAAQYIRGDGQLATLPSGASGGSAVNYYLNGSVAASVGTYFQMSKIAVLGAGTDFSKAGNGLISQFLTDVADPNRLEIPAGAWNFEIYMSASSSGGTPAFYVEFLKYVGTTFTSIASSSANPEAITSGTIIDLYLTSLAIPQTTLLATDRLAIRVYIVNSTGGRTITMHTENSHLSEIITNFAGGIAALNGLTANTQYLATGTSGTDFAISSLTDTHTFNLPTASATNRGALSSADWSTFNGKISGSGVANQLTYWNGTGSVTGSAGLVYNDSTGIMTLSKNQNAQTYLNISNTDTGTNANASLVFSNNLGVGYGQIFLYNTSSTPYKAIGSGDLGIYRTGSQDITFQHDSTGKMKWAMGGATTAQMTLTAAGRLLIGTTTEGTNLLDVNGGVNITGIASIVGGLAVDTNTLFVDAANNRVGVGNTTPLSNIDVRQTSTNKNGIWITGAEYTNPSVGNDANNGIAIILGVNRTANRQVWIGSSEVIGSSTLGVIRFQTGTNIPSIDATTGNGSTRLNINIATGTTNVIIGQPDGNTTLPASCLSVARNFSVGANYLGIAAPTNGAIIEGNVLIGTSTVGTFLLDVNGTARVSGLLTLPTGISTGGASSLYIGVGDVSPFGGGNNIIIGNTSGTLYTTGTNNITIGNQTISQTLTRVIQLGFQTNVTGGNAIAIGTQLSCSGNSIAIGNRPIVSGSNSINISNALFGIDQNKITNNQCFIIGSSVSLESTADNQGILNAYNLFIGRPARATSTLGDSKDGVATSINGMGGYAKTDATGGNLTINGGVGLGAGTSGDIIFGTATPATSGTTIQTLTSRWWVKGSTGTLSNVASPNASAQVQIDSTTQGFLPPRMTTTQKNAIATPAAGLQVYDSTLNQMSYYNGTTWVNF